MSLLELFCSVDDFWQQYAPNWQHSLMTSGKRQHLRATQMYPSEMMTILILFQQSHYRTFKAYYTEYVQRHLRSEFPTLVSYQRFVELMPTLLVPLVADLHTQLGRCSGISFIDSTSLAVCRNPRIHQHRVFDGRAARGKTSVGWFYGFKLHLVVNDQGELLAFCLTLGNVDDLRPVGRKWRAEIGIQATIQHIFVDIGISTKDAQIVVILPQGFLLTRTIFYL
jgi:Transposase DDE domain